MHYGVEPGLERDHSQDIAYKIQCLGELYQWLENIDTSPFHSTYGNIKTTQYNEISYALDLKNLTIDDLFGVLPNRTTQLIPIYQSLNITLETEPYYHMRKVFSVTQEYYKNHHFLPKNVTQGLQCIINEQIQSYRNQHSAKSLPKFSIHNHNGYHRIPEYESNVASKRPRDCVERIKDYLARRF